MMSKRITVSKARMIVDNVFSNILGQHSAVDRIIMDNGVSVGLGACEPIGNDRYVLHVGSKGMFSGKQRLFRSPEIEPLALTQGLVVVFHEVEHVKQNQGVYHDVSSRGFSYAVTELATCGNKSYYLRMQNYLSNLSEISAEKAGVVHAMECLSDDGFFAYSAEQAESML